MATQQNAIDTLVSGAVKAAMDTAAATKSDMYKVPIGNIHVIPGFNVRADTPDYREHISNLAKLILENGFRSDKPLSGYVAAEGGQNVVYITDGHSRLEAAKLAIANGAAIEALPVVVSPKGTSKEDLIVGLVVSNTGRPLTPLETAEVCNRLVVCGWKESKIAAKLGFSARYVSDLLTLLSAPKALRDMVSNGTVSATLAIEEFTKAPEEAVANLKAGLAVVQAKGGTKVTKKHVRTAAAGEAPPKPREALKKLMEFHWTTIGGREADVKLLKQAIKMARAIVGDYVPPAEE